MAEFSVFLGAERWQGIRRGEPRERVGNKKK